MNNNGRIPDITFIKSYQLILTFVPFPSASVPPKSSQVPGQSLPCLSMPGCCSGQRRLCSWAPPAQRQSKCS